MNELSHTAPDPSIPIQQTQAHYASVTEQIAELEVQNSADEGAIRAMQDSIAARRAAIADRKAKIAKWKRRKRIFAKARFDLEQVDEE